MTDVEHFFLFFGHLSTSFGEVSVQVFGPLLKWVGVFCFAWGFCCYYLVEF